MVRRWMPWACEPALAGHDGAQSDPGRDQDFAGEAQMKPVWKANGLGRKEFFLMIKGSPTPFAIVRSLETGWYWTREECGDLHGPYPRLYEAKAAAMREFNLDAIPR